MHQLWPHSFAPGPVFAVLCAVFALTVPVVWWQYYRRGRWATVRFPFARPGQSAALPAGWVQRTRWVVPLLRTLAVTALIFALARPQAGGFREETARGIAIEMVLDVSGSMAEADFAWGGKWVRRLDAVRRVFRDFVLGVGELPGRPNDLLGMTTFAMYADVKSPLTRDHGHLVELLDATEIPGWVDGVERQRNVESSYTSLGDAVVLATDELRRVGEQAAAGVPGAEAAKSRVMILLTDGADNPPPQVKAEAPDPVEAAKLAASLGIRIYTIGAVGAQQQQRGFDLFGPRTAAVDERTLKAIAEVGNGRYFRATDTESLITIYEEIDKLERRSTGERQYRDNLGAARTALAIALALLGVETLLAQTRYRRSP